MTGRVEIQYGLPQDEAELQRASALTAETFGVGPDREQEYVAQVGSENFRVARVNGEIVGSLALLHAGQWFNGRSVPMTGIAAVAVAPGFRGRGVATQMLREMLVELRHAGVPISCLYPATVALYRRVGYELAGASYEYALPALRVDTRERGLDVRAACEADEVAIRDVYQQWAATTSGNIDRNEFFWKRVRLMRGEPTRSYVVTEQDRIVGYTFVRERPGKVHLQDLYVQDLAYTTSAAARRLLTFLADHRTIRDRVAWRGGPGDPLLGLLGEAPEEISRHTVWMVRIVDVAAALAARAYPPGLSAELHLAVKDDVLPDNEGHCVLHVAEGRGAVSPGGSGSLVIDVRGLAALYTGHQTATDLETRGLLSGPAEELARLTAAFAAPAPWMRDEF